MLIHSFSPPLCSWMRSNERRCLPFSAWPKETVHFSPWSMKLWNCVTAEATTIHTLSYSFCFPRFIKYNSFRLYSVLASVPNFDSVILNQVDLESSILPIHEMNGKWWWLTPQRCQLHRTIFNELANRTRKLCPSSICIWQRPTSAKSLITGSLFTYYY